MVQMPNCSDTLLPSTSLQPASLIIAFHNEAWSTLLRTVHSALSRSPPHLLTQVVLVDDASDMAHLGKPLEEYTAKWTGRVHLIRSGERIGLAKARLLGVEKA